MPAALPVNVDTTYADDAGDASVKTHQQHHDEIHAFVNAGAGGSPLDANNIIAVRIFSR